MQLDLNSKDGEVVVGALFSLVSNAAREAERGVGGDRVTDWLRAKSTGGGRRDEP